MSFGLLRGFWDRDEKMKMLNLLKKGQLLTKRLSSLIRLMESAGSVSDLESSEIS